MDYRGDALSDTRDGGPWQARTPRCLLFSTSNILGNFAHAAAPALKGFELVDKRYYVYILKTTALRHFDIVSHFEWTDAGFRGKNLERLLAQEYRYEFEQLRTQGKNMTHIVNVLGRQMINDRNRVDRFPVAQNQTIEVPKPRHHMAILHCKKSQPVRDITIAQLDLLRPAANVYAISPGLSDMLSGLDNG